jgi:hypothetical protein
MVSTTFRGWVWLLLWLRHLPYPPIYISSCYQTQKVDGRMAGWLEEESFIFRHGLSLPFVDTYTRYTERQGVDKHDIHTHKNGKWWTIRLATRHLGSPSVSHRVPLETAAGCLVYDIKIKQ